MGTRQRIDGTDAERPPRWARWFVGLFLGAFVVSALAGIEAWPLTGWRLFSHLRHEHQTTWQAVAVDASGVETRVSFARLPSAYQGSTLIVSQFGSVPPGRQVRTCRTWAAAPDLLHAPAAVDAVEAGHDRGPGLRGGRRGAGRGRAALADHPPGCLGLRRGPQRDGHQHREGGAQRRAAAPLVPLLAAPTGNAWSLDAIRRPPAPVSARHGWPARTAMVVVAGGYFFTGLNKLVFSGPAWVTSGTLRWVLYAASGARARPV